MTKLITCKATVELTINVFADTIEDARVLITSGKGELVDQKQVSVEQVAITDIPDGAENKSAILGNRKRRRFGRKLVNRA